jgi:hypothetical protein
MVCKTGEFSTDDLGILRPMMTRSSHQLGAPESRPFHVSIAMGQEPINVLNVPLADL